MLGRFKDHYQRENGELVFLFDIEEEILKNENVAQCKAVYSKTAAGGQPIAYIVLRSGTVDKMAVLKHIHRHLVDTLPEYMVPEHYKIRTAMPVHNNGKMDVAALRNDREELIPAERLRL